MEYEAIVAAKYEFQLASDIEGDSGVPTVVLLAANCFNSPEWDTG